MSCRPGGPTPPPPGPPDADDEEAFCIRHRLCRTALLACSDAAAKVVDTFHAMRPSFLEDVPLPASAEGGGGAHACSPAEQSPEVRRENKGETNVFPTLY